MNDTGLEERELNDTELKDTSLEDNGKGMQDWRIKDNVIQDWSLHW